MPLNLLLFRCEGSLHGGGFFRFPESGQHLVGGSDHSRYGDMSCCSDSSLSTRSEWSPDCPSKDCFPCDGGTFWPNSDVRLQQFAQDVLPQQQVDSSW